MPAQRPHKASVGASWVHSSRLHVVLYSFLLVATPFLLLRVYLVNAIGALSDTRIDLVGLELPVVPVSAAAAVLIAAVLLRRQVTTIRVTGFLVALGMIALAQQITDFYFGHNFYDLQQNWHYLAYGIFAYMLHRDLTSRGMSRARVMLFTSLAALGFSTFDELFQMFLGSRVFDASDIAKDFWGAQAGIILIYFGRHSWSELRADLSQFHYQRLREYFDHPATTLTAQLGFGFILLNVSSLLAEARHWDVVAMLTLGLFVVAAATWHVAGMRRWRGLILGLLGLLLVAQTTSYAVNRHGGITHQQYGITVYRGVVIPVFDVLIYPDGGFRLVDKKHSFNSRDIDFFLRQRPDILVVASGHDGNGGQGFFSETTRFLYNQYLARGTQVIILPTPEACRLYNRLHEEGKHVLFVLHSTC